MIDVKDIVQINATVIAGLLILLTIASFQGGLVVDTTQAMGTPIKAAFITIIPFVISSCLAIYAMISQYLKKQERKYFVAFSLASMLIGFAYIGVYLVYLVLGYY